MASFHSVCRFSSRLPAGHITRRTASRGFQTLHASLAEASSSPHEGGTKQHYPLYPSVHHLLKENGLPASEADKIPASGPNGRLLKGDVLAYVGSIASSYPADLSSQIGKREHLDLSNIKLAAPPSAPAPAAPSAKAAAAAAATPEPEPAAEIAVPISLAAVFSVQKRIKDTLGVHLPLSTFIARATEVANDALPLSKSAPASADRLFNQILGLDKLSAHTSRGSFTPQITALPPSSLSSPRKASPKPQDVYDILTGSTSAPAAAPVLDVPEGINAGSGGAANVFSVSVARGEEERARLFLERVKLILEAEPGRLVL